MTPTGLYANPFWSLSETHYQWEDIDRTESADDGWRIYLSDGRMYSVPWQSGKKSFFAAIEYTSEHLVKIHSGTPYRSPIRCSE